MALLASCPATKGEFRIWAWSTKNEKLNGFRDEKNDGNGPGEAQPGSSLQWSRNGKVVQYIEGYKLCLRISANDLERSGFGM